MKNASKDNSNLKLIHFGTFPFSDTTLWKSFKKFPIDCVVKVRVLWGEEGVFVVFCWLWIFIDCGR